MSISHTVPAIEINDLSFRYNVHAVLDNISFRIEAGNYVGIIGPNGGGKTTLLRLLLGLLKPQTGIIKIFGTEIQQYQHRYELGYVPQHVSQDNINLPASVYEIVESGRTARLGLFARPGKADIHAINKALEIARVAEFRKSMMSELSGGQRQRVYVARALAAEPKVLFLDEPFIGIDLAAQEDFYAFLRELNETQGLTILFVSHDVDIISAEVKELLCLNRRLVCQGKPHELIEEHMIEKLYGKTITHIHHEHVK